MTARADPGEAYELIRASPRPDLEAAVRAAWALDTCDPVDAADWSPANPSRGQCGSTALIIHDVLGGELLIAEVVRGDGSRRACTTGICCPTMRGRVFDALGAVASRCRYQQMQGQGADECAGSQPGD
jgi:hypothetical protein